MALTGPLPLLPQGAREVSSSLAILDDGTRVVFFDAAGPICSFRKEDRTGVRLGALTVIEQGRAGPTAVANARRSCGVYHCESPAVWVPVVAFAVCGLCCKSHALRSLIGADDGVPSMTDPTTNWTVVERAGRLLRAGHGPTVAARRGCARPSER